MTRYAYNISDYRKLAKKRIPKGIFEYIDRGSENEIALKRNREAFDCIEIIPRFLRDVHSVDTATCILGCTYQTPLIVAPTAFSGLVWNNGEQLIARAAGHLGVPTCVAMMSITPLEMIAQGTTVPPWFQLYFWKNREKTYNLIKRVETAGIDKLIITVDGPVRANREYNGRNGFGMPFRFSCRSILDLARHPSWLISTILPHLWETGLPSLVHYPTNAQPNILHAPNDGSIGLANDLTWEDIKTLRDKWRGKILLKGILDVEDALLAKSIGVDGLVLSNHGGRNLDSSPSALSVLAQILQHVGKDMTLLVDGGIMRGSDIFKAVALGASGVLAGRAPLWGLAAKGEEGARAAISILIQEFKTTMALAGCRNISETKKIHIT